MFKICNHVNCKSSFIIYLLECYISVTFNMLINQKHHSKLGSITTEKMSKIPMQYQIVIISSSTIMNLTIRKFIIIDQLRNIRTPWNEGLTRKPRKLETLVPHGLIQDLNWSHAMQMCHYLPLFFVFAYGLKKLMSVIISSSTCISQILHICWERPRLRLVGKIVNFY